jgi:hypothetical protein
MVFDTLLLPPNNKLFGALLPKVELGIFLDIISTLLKIDTP